MNLLNLKIEDILPDMENILKQTKYLSDTIDDFRDFIKNSNKKRKKIQVSKKLLKNSFYLFSILLWKIIILQ